MSNLIEAVWIFNGKGSRFPAGVFTNKNIAEHWIRLYSLTGILTLYPMDEGVYNWAIKNSIFEPKKERENSPEFIGSFSSASQEHYHYIDGELD